MAEKTRIIDIYEKKGGFTSYFRKFSGSKKDYNFSDLSLLRQLFSNEKARLLHFIKMKKPDSIYSLAKSLGKDFKTVRSDIEILKKFGFIEISEEKKNGRIIHKPFLTANTINISIRI